MTSKAFSFACIAACLGAIVTSSGSWARPVTPGIGGTTFKARCQDTGGSYTAYRHGNVNCDLPDGAVATCNFIIPSCMYRGPGDVNLAASQFLGLSGQ